VAFGLIYNAGGKVVRTCKIKSTILVDADADSFTGQGQLVICASPDFHNCSAAPRFAQLTGMLLGRGVKSRWVSQPVVSANSSRWPQFRPPICPAIAGANRRHHCGSRVGVR
jgi:hypothetical protein